ncbi:acyl-CoA dehydrogenase domain protein [Burkholderia sp. H160]|nr:acyl-CoA dehydrogenase domain protein [Burkholderia sp. H160]
MDDNNDIRALLRQSAIDYLGARPAQKQEPGSVPAFDAAGWRELAGLGWLGVGLPEALGGPGLGLREAAVLCEEFGRVASPMPYLAASLLPSLLLAACPHGPTSCELAEQLVSGARPFALAWQDSAGQADKAIPLTKYIEGRVCGTKRFVAGGGHDGVLLLTAQNGAAPVLVAVDANAPGVTQEPYAAGLGSDATIRFDRAPTLFEAPLASGTDAQRALSIALQAGRVAIAAQLAGLAASVLDKTLAYVSTRVQFGRPISSFQAIRHRCVDLHIDSRLASASWQHALRALEAAPDAPETAAAVSAAKARCGDVAVQTGLRAVQMHGAMGFIEEGGVGVYLRAALHGRAWLGTPAEQRRRFIALDAATREALHV